MIDKVAIAGKAVNGLVHLFPNNIGRLMLDLFCKPIGGRIFTKREKAFLDKST